MSKVEFAPLKIVLVVLLLAGCDITYDETLIATEVCKPHEGLRWITFTGYKAICRNGVEVYYGPLVKR